MRPVQEVSGWTSQPGWGRSFTVEWINPARGDTIVAGGVLGGDARETFSSPFNNSGAVLYLRTVRPIRTVRPSAASSVLPTNPAETRSAAR